MKNEPRNIYLNLGNIEHEDVTDFDELSEITWSEERIDVFDIKYLNEGVLVPVFDILEKLLERGAYISKQDGVWVLFDKDGELLISGKSIREMCINLILSDV